MELFFDLVARLEIERFVEAGAKDGTASRRAAKTIDTVVAFEANPYTFSRFAALFDNTPVHYELLALSDTAGQVTFHVRRNDAGNPMSDGQGSLLVRSTYSPGYADVTVGAVRLDDYFAPAGRTRTALWVDVEGTSASVLRGARSLLAETELVMIEVEERQAWDDQEWLANDVIRFLGGFGLEPVARDRQSRFQHNIVFFRSERLFRRDVSQALTIWRNEV